jgi:hypothetical protein
MKNIIAIVLWLIFSQVSIGQIAFIDKVNKGDKSILVVVINNEAGVNRYSANCSFGPVLKLPDTSKIRLITELFEWLSDTTICYNPVYNLAGHYEVIRKTPMTKEYNLQIEALLLINYIAFSSHAFAYSPYPLLYDKRKEKEIFSFGGELTKIIERYRKWFKRAKRGGFKNYDYPLCSKRFEWFGSKVKDRNFDTLPSWDKSYDCKMEDVINFRFNSSVLCLQK